LARDKKKWIWPGATKVDDNYRVCLTLLVQKKKTKKSKA
jgi:hypothetical protein